MGTEHESRDRDVWVRTAPLYTRDVGQGQAILLLHAFPLNGRMWEPQLERLGTRARLLAPDMPGFGLSPLRPETPTLDDYAHATIGVLDRLGVDRVVVAGLSMGGYVAFRLVEALGPRLIGLLLADTKATPDTAEAALRRHELAAEVEAVGVDAAADELIPKLLGVTTQRLKPALIDHVRSLIRESSPAGVAAALRAMAERPDSTPLLRRIACPVVCVVGEEDVVTPPDVGRAMGEQLPETRVLTLPLAGHLTSLEAPAEFNAAVVELLAEVRRPRQQAAGFRGESVRR